MFLRNTEKRCGAVMEPNVICKTFDVFRDQRLETQIELNSISRQNCP